MAKTGWKFKLLSPQIIVEAKKDLIILRDKTE